MCLLLFRKIYCAFHKHENSKVQKPPSQLRFSLPSIIITITSNEPSNTETHKTDRNPPITNHKPWPFEPVKDDWLQRKTQSSVGFSLSLLFLFFFSFFFSSFASGFWSFSLCTFSKIQLDNVLALTVNHTLIFVNVPTSANIRLHYSFKIFPWFWLAKSTRFIHHNQLPMTKLGRILCLTRKWRQKYSVFVG